MSVAEAGPLVPVQWRLGLWGTQGVLCVLTAQL